MSESTYGHQPPRCPSCRWHLGFEARDKTWEGFCWNPNCKVNVVPPSLNEVLLAFVKDQGEVLSADVAELFGWSYQNADNHLTRLLQVGVVQRRRIDPVKGGKRFAWSPA